MLLPKKMVNIKVRTRNYIFGKNAEELVCNYLIERHYTILKRRYKCSYGEVDIIAKHNNTLAFIEVKARRKLEHLEVLSLQQVQRISQASQHFLSLYPHEEIQQMRFDLVIVAEDRIFSYLENAWSM